MPGKHVNAYARTDATYAGPVGSTYGSDPIWYNPDGSGSRGHWSFGGSEHRDEPAHRASGYWIGYIKYDTSRGDYIGYDWGNLPGDGDSLEAAEE